MRYPIVLHKDEGSDYGVTVPDIAGCFSAGATIDEALKNAYAAVDGHLKILADEGEFVVPQSTSVDDHINSGEYNEGVWRFVDIDVTPYLDK